MTRRATRRALGAIGWVAVCCAVTASASAGGRTTDPVVPGFVRGFAFDAGRVAWIDPVWFLHVRVLRTGVETRLVYTKQYEEIPDYSGGAVLELAQDRLWWLSRRGEDSTGDVAEHVYEAPVTAVRGRRVATYENNTIEGGFVTGIGADRLGASYSFVQRETSDPDLSPPCSSTGGSKSLVGGRWRRLAGVEPGLLMARAEGRLALAPTEAERSCGQPAPAGTVEVRNGATGSLVSTFAPGRIEAASMSATTVAVLAGGSVGERTVAGRSHVPVVTGARIERYDIASGRLVGSTPAPFQTVIDLDMDGDRVVFRTRYSVRVLDTRTGRVSTIASTSPWQPGGVAIDGNTVAWVETKRIAPGEPSRKTFQSRIRTRTLAPAG